MSKVVLGKLYECVAAKSQFYTKGKVYEAVTKDGKVVFQGDDGLYDEPSNLVSLFKPYIPEGTPLKTKRNFSLTG